VDAAHSLDAEWYLTLAPRDDRVMTVRMDVTDVGTTEKARETVERRFGGVDVLVNNAGVLLFENEDVLSTPSEGYRRTFDTNVFDVIEVCRVFAPAMARARYGRIVNVSSGAGQRATMSGYAPAYSISNAALKAFARILAHSYRHRGVLVNAVIWVAAARTWAAPRPPDRRRKERTRSRGSRRFPTPVRAAGSSTIVAINW